jgi:hypothetical protein
MLVSTKLKMTGTIPVSLSDLAKSGKGGIPSFFLLTSGIYGGGQAAKFIPPYDQVASVICLGCMSAGALGLAAGVVIGLLRPPIAAANSLSASPSA